jgi:RimJ/RimL family protein N-acetyltransferase
VDPLTDLPHGNLMTTRLRLRSWRDDDVAPMLAMSTDPEVMRHFPRPMTAGEVRAFVVRHRDLLAAGRPGLYAVERRGDDSFIGFVGLAEPTFEAPFTPCVEIGWRLVRGAWGHGLATEAAREVLRHGFEELGLTETVSFTTLRNERSIAVMRRLGMHTDPADDFDHPGVPEGHEARRHVLYRLTVDEWRAQEGR